MSGPSPVSVAVLLAPGASGTREHPLLVALDDALSAAGMAVERTNLPTTRPGPRVQSAITDAAGALAACAGLAPARVVLGGQSFGGRMCSMAVADGLPALGLVLISYPLHPPGRPETMRVEHLPRLTVPCLFVSGTRDAFATPAELEAATAAIPGDVTHVWIEGGNHGLRGKVTQVTDAVRDWAVTLAAGGPRG